MSWFPVPLEVPRGGRIVIGGRNIIRESCVEIAGAVVDSVEAGEADDEFAHVDVSKKPVQRVTRKVKAVPAHSKSPYFRRGKELRYKRDRCPKGSEGVIFQVKEHNAIGISFYDKEGVFSSDYFEPVS